MKEKFLKWLQKELAKLQQHFGGKNQETCPYQDSQNFGAESGGQHD